MNDMKTIRRTLVLVFIMAFIFSCIEDDSIEEQIYSEEHEVIMTGEDEAEDLEDSKKI